MNAPHAQTVTLTNLTALERKEQKMKRTPRSVLASSIALATALLGGIACEGDPNTAVATPEVSMATQALQLANGAQLWPHEVPVCFVYGKTLWTDKYWTTFRNNLQTWIPNQLGRHVDLRFTGWGQCPTNTAGRITVKYTNGGTDHSNSNLGYNSAGPTVVDFHDDAVVLNPTWQETKALHEFMHALGFIHEWETSANTSNDCGYASLNTVGQRYGTPYDHASLLNATYCPGMDTQHDYSVWDLIGMQRAYGRKPTGSIVGSNNLCLQMSTVGSSDTPIATYDCTGAAVEQWKYTATNGIATESSYAYGNMDAEGGIAAAHTRVVNWVANSTPAQNWTLANVQIVGLGGFCLGVKGGNIAVNQTVELASCSDTANAQQWTVKMTSLSGQDRFQLAASGGSLCATVGASDSMTLQSCNSASTAQLFRWNANQQISSELTSRCLDVFNGVPQAGALVQPYYCWPVPTDPTDYRMTSQTWYIHGRIKGLGGYCLNTVSSSPINGTGAELQSCSTSTTWDVYPYIGQ